MFNNDAQSVFLKKWLKNLIQPLYSGIFKNDNNYSEQFQPISDCEWSELPNKFIPQGERVIRQISSEEMKMFGADSYNVIPLSSSLLSNNNHIIKITKFFKVNNYKICASVQDAECQILVELTPICVTEYERKTRDRMTSNTLDCLFVIGDCRLYFQNKNEVLHNFNCNTFRNIIPGLNALDRDSLIPVLVINQIICVDRHPSKSLSTLPFLHSYL
ncbi:hypothetical protein TBLA_0A00960 [Henningerozyma blattae CBS 6284]|uniref:Telomere replication protein EST3 n=1 Tax=Henningerozyma blattae (strain ATCC 34711 / CBS 6284 / DSM 70876 / NBRC 10599 / NRRL Y-10934 / UCD 77-7) TaxID=1071380 RepID=I2GUU4_HENB6|nr:LOW QUALITY PROTEIN: hypothetical protein TBLA_0A00960 [Tetrapisispora blattae CBS 6284]CCH57896.1 hypothetical protein TBLA_0A00960 [Tetrapisispora blattae CBS 6284]